MKVPVCRSWLRVSSAPWWWNTKIQLKLNWVACFQIYRSLHTHTHTHTHNRLLCGKHDWERPMAGGMGESVPHVERGNILQKFTANLNLMGHSLSLCYSFWCRWALMKWELRPRSNQNRSSGAPHGWATKGHGVRGQAAWHIAGWDMHRVVTGRLHQFLTSNSTFKTGNLLKFCTCGHCYGGFLYEWNLLKGPRNLFHYMTTDKMPQPTGVLLISEVSRK